MIIASAVVVLILALAAAGPGLIPSATYRGMVEDALRERLNARVEIKKFAFRVIPYPGYTITGFRLISDAPPFQGMTLLSAEKVVGSLSFLALLRGRIVTGIELRDANLDLRFAQGLSNLGAMLRLQAPLPAASVPEIKSIGVQGLAPEAAPAPAEFPGEGRPAPGSTPEGSVPEFRSMPAPSMEPPAVDEGGDAVPEFRAPGAPSGALPFGLINEAQAAGPSGGGMPLSIRSVDAVRSRILIDAESMPRPVVIGNASFSLREISAEGGISMKMKLTGAVGEATSPNLSAECRLSIDDANREARAEGLRIYFNGSQFAGNASANYGSSPVSLDIHLASPDLVPASAGALLAYSGRSLPPALSWQGRLAVDARYAGTADAGRLSLSLDARDALISSAGPLKKEQGGALKVAFESTISDAALSISKGSVVIGSGEFSVTGEIGRDDILSASLVLSGSGLGAEAAGFFMPGLSAAADIGEFSAEVRMTGPLAGDSPAAVSGRVEAPKVTAAGIEISDVAFSFERGDDSISLVSIRGSFAGGEVSGTGRIATQPIPSIEFDVVGHDVDASGIKSAAGLVSGKAGLVVRGRGEGADDYSLQQDLVLSGTIVMPEFAGSALRSLAGFFDPKLVDRIASASGVKLEPSALPGREGEEAPGSDLKASFEIAKGLLSIDGASFSGDRFAARLSASAQPDTSLAGEGEAWIDAETARGIAPDPAAQKALLESDGRLLIPVEIRGTISRPQVSFVESKFTEMMQAGRRIKERAAEAAKGEEAKAKPKPKPPGQAQTPRPKPKSAPKKKAPTGKPSSTSPIDDVEQVLKVIVGE